MTRVVDLSKTSATEASKDGVTVERAFSVVIAIAHALFSNEGFLDRLPRRQSRCETPVTVNVRSST